MNLQEIIDKYEERNKIRLKSIIKEDKKKIKSVLLNLHIETEEIINDLKELL